MCRNGLACNQKTRLLCSALGLVCACPWHPRTFVTTPAPHISLNQTSRCTNKAGWTSGHNDELLLSLLEAWGSREVLPTHHGVGPWQALLGLCRPGAWRLCRAAAAHSCAVGGPAERRACCYPFWREPADQRECSGWALCPDSGQQAAAAAMSTAGPPVALQTAVLTPSLLTPFLLRRPLLSAALPSSSVPCRRATAATCCSCRRRAATAAAALPCCWARCGRS